MPEAGYTTVFGSLRLDHVITPAISRKLITSSSNAVTSLRRIVALRCL
jgi:hypothetical protein